MQIFNVYKQGIQATNPLLYDHIHKLSYTYWTGEGDEQVQIGTFFVS